ncbi:MAG: ROK family protein [Rhodocyclaceae bacterium]|nr:ROK family protein [Rhodocyclaceae bacterium]
MAQGRKIQSGTRFAVVAGTVAKPGDARCAAIRLWSHTEVTVRIGIDLGGTKIEVIALDGRGHCLLRERVATPQGDYAATLRAIVGLIELAKSSVGAGNTPLLVVGIGIPGTESADSGLIKNANSTWLNGKPLRQDLQSLLGCNIRLANDANCFALSEAIDGAATGAAVVFGVILGTGVGGGVVVNGQVLKGINGIAGEWGHNPLPEFANEIGDHDRVCYCGRKHCIELYLSGPGLVHDHAHSLKAPDAHRTLFGAPPAYRPRVTSTNWRADAIATAAQSGDLGCEASMQRYEHRLARALAGVINILDPDVIVLGGGLSNIERLYENVPRLWATDVFSDTVKTRLVKPMHGDSSGVRGAAWLIS